MKAISLPLYLPLAWWLIAHPAGWLLAAVPRPGPHAPFGPTPGEPIQ